MSKPSTAQTDFEEIRRLIADFQREGKAPNDIGHPRLSIFAGHHGFASTLPDSFNNYVKKSVEGSAPINRLCANANMDLRLYEMDLDGSTQNCLEYGFALSQDEFVKSVAYGMMAVEPSLDLLCVSALGNGTMNTSESVCQIHDLKTKTSDDLLNKKLKDVARTSKGLDIIPMIGGYEIAALCGLIIAARLAQIPVLLEGVIGLSAIAILTAENKHACDHVAITGAVDPAVLQNLEIAYIPTPHAIPPEAGLAMAYLVPNLRSQIIIETLLQHSEHSHACGSGCGHNH
jgi:nicotinate-nucleotide--dimethylbenzimidazole phosphoribosyltransferase